MVSNMYDQCSHCFKMYHVNINTSCQIAGFGMFVWRQGGVRASADVGALAHRMGRGFLLRRMCGHRSVVEALPASGYVIVPGGDCSSLGSDASSEKNAVSPPREHPLFLSLASPKRAPRREPLYFLWVVSHWFLLNLKSVFVWSLEDSFSQNTIVKTPRSSVSSERLDFSDIWPTFSSKWDLWIRKCYSDKVWSPLRVTEENFSFFSREPSRGLKKRCAEGSLHISLDSCQKGWLFQTTGKGEKQQEMLGIRKWMERNKPWRLVIKRWLENFIRALSLDWGGGHKPG